MMGSSASIENSRSRGVAGRKEFLPLVPLVANTMYDAFSAQLRPLPELNNEALQALVDVGASADQRTKTLKPLDIIEPRFFDELKASQFLKDLYTEKVSL